jgi:hypothetical protein
MHFIVIVKTINWAFLQQFPLPKIAFRFLFALCFPFLVTYSFFKKCLGAGFGRFTSSYFHCYFYITSPIDRFLVSH